MLARPANAAGQICDKLEKFTSAQFTADVEPQGRRWVELHWRGLWMDFDRGWGFTCLHSPDAASTELCNWLTGNTSYEFASETPKAILRCYGYKIPVSDTWQDWKATVGLDREGRFLLLEIDLDSLAAGNQAIRLSSFDEGYDDTIAELPPMKTHSGRLTE
jgi:hypothetical protein